MNFSKPPLLKIAVFILASAVTSVSISQEIDLEMSKLGETGSVYRAKLTFFPATSNVTPSTNSGNSSTNQNPVTFEFSVQLNLSSSWLLEDDPDRELSEEEMFTREFFLARKNASSLADLRGYMDDNFYREKETLYARNEEARERELSAFENFTDIRLLGVVIYGNFYFFLNIIERPSETSPEIRAGFAARKHDGRYLQTNALSGDIAIGLFRPGMLQEEIYTALEQLGQ
ncbi:hypothetical protein [Pseudohongiella nitratireducens]|nr:hypothetical protein [Pseudohongiella nitratireducens]